MTSTKINGFRQIQDATIKDQQIATDAAIATSKLADGADFARLTHYITKETPTGAMDGTNVTFTLAHTPVIGTDELYLNGLLQEPGATNDYTISGSTITYNSAPLTTDRLTVTYWKI